MLDERQPHLHRLFHHICHIACLQFAHQVVAVKFYGIVDDGKNEKTELAAVAQQKGKQASNADAQKEDIQAPAGTQQSTEKEETGVLMGIALLLLALVGGALSLIAIVFTFFYVFSDVERTFNVAERNFLLGVEIYLIEENTDYHRE